MMTLPNKLTIGRICAIPAIIIVACIPYFNTYTVFGGVTIANFINVLIFALASATDFLDGHIARKHNLVTTFGKFADPLADKCLVLTALLILMNNGSVVFLAGTLFNLAPMWAVSIILLRELIVSGVRLVAAERGEVIAAGWAGKVKTFVTMVAIIFIFLAGIHKVVGVIALVLMYASVILTIYSGVEYVYNSRKIIFESI
jgi:CDP-diacylglycerol--glycerol-3-phosphate 3-phosphatidyltransferase